MGRYDFFLLAFSSAITFLAGKRCLRVKIRATKSTRMASGWDLTPELSTTEPLRPPSSDSTTTFKRLAVGRVKQKEWGRGEDIRKGKRRCNEAKNGTHVSPPCTIPATSSNTTTTTSTTPCHTPHFLLFSLQSLPAFAFPSFFFSSCLRNKGERKGRKKQTKILLWCYTCFFHCLLFLMLSSLHSYSKVFSHLAPTFLTFWNNKLWNNWDHPVLHNSSSFILSLYNHSLLSFLLTVRRGNIE